MEPDIVERPVLRVVGLHASFRHGLSPETNAPEVIGPLWHRFIGRRDELPPSAVLYGVIWGLPEEERAHPHQLEYLCGAPVDEIGALPDGMMSREVPSATFASVLHRGPISKIAETLTVLYREWLPNSGWEHSGLADVEVYDDRFQGDDADSVMEYRISVRPRA